MSFVRKFSVPLALALATAFGGFATQAISRSAEANASIILNARLSALEQQMAEVKADNVRLRAVQADARSFSTFGSSNVVTAPFKVVNTDGETVFEVQDDGEGRFARLVSGNLSVEMTASDFIGLHIADNGKPIASIGRPPGRGVALRFYKGDAQFAGIGAKPDGGAALYIGTGTQNGFEVDVDSSGNGTLAVLGGGNWAASINSKERRVITYNDAGVPTAAMGMSDKHQGGNIVLMNSQGQGVVSGGGTVDGEGALCVTRHKNGLTCLGIGLPMR